MLREPWGGLKHAQICPANIGSTTKLDSLEHRKCSNNFHKLTYNGHIGYF